MSPANPTFKAADLSTQFKTACTQFDALLASATSQELASVRKKFRDGLKTYKQQGTLTVAFVGQYSAGKSTIISALTGRRDIHIDSDIATDKTTSYDWNGIKIIDTPGLFTDRTDHDEITYEAIARADLLVFCLTHMLFDTTTVENFKKLAYDKGYRWKIMLVINKMSAAAGDEEQKISSYRYSLGEALKPYALTEFPTCFIDAKDYCDGIDDDDDFLTEVSHFETFIAELNHFVKRRSALTRLDTPVRIALTALDEAQISFARNSDEDTAFLEVLSRLSRRVSKERERLRTKVKNIILEMSSAINTEGFRLASAVGDSTFEDLNKRAEINVRKYYEKAGDDFENKVKNALESIREEVEAELQSNLTKAFVAQLEFTGNISGKNLVSNVNPGQLREQVVWLQNIGEQVGAKITSAATNSLATAGSGLLHSGNVAGSTLHQGIYSIGKFIGVKFKPWQAVGMAKNLGNAAKFLGPAMAVVCIGLDLHAMHKEREYEQQMADIRRDITSQFQTIAIDLEQQIKEQLQEFESQCYDLIEKNIAQARQQIVSVMDLSNKELKQIAAIRPKLEAILQEVQKAAKSDDT